MTIYCKADLFVAWVVGFWDAVLSVERHRRWEADQARPVLWWKWSRWMDQQRPHLHLHI